ncbi:MAG TPA: hypothetical protein VMI75_34460 [Polyangiaceae bacterium]|nr:hypothetical protein [Polyangiaceae bacterium]
MKFNVPVTVTVEAPSREKAMESARTIQKLLGEPMVMSVLTTQGVDVKQIQVYEPKLG